ELESLIKTAGGRVVGHVMQNLRSPNSKTYIGSGKALEVAHLAHEKGANVIVFDNDLSPAQIGALEKVINTELKSPLGKGVKVLDRSELILDIFATRAQTYEAKLQVELAQMQYTYPRLTKMWGHLERLAGGGGSLGIGTRGPGETQLEIDRRLVRKRISDLKKDIEKVQDRKSRLVAKRNLNHITVCIIGYTNAGKSTLFNTLTDAGAYADNKLFATLDTKTRAWEPQRGAKVMLSDTVGFVRDLPHNLVASFKATLEEAVHADLLLHVLDVGHPHAQQQFESVRQVLKEIGAQDDNMSRAEILLLNKIDTPEGEERLPYWQALYPDALAISARGGVGLDKLAERVIGFTRGQQVEVTLEVDITDGKTISQIESSIQILTRRITDQTIEFDVTVGRNMLEQISRVEAIRVLESAKSA
ncbi:MAG TPA: GTPase HflX, partial [Tepidisphaeraceae bacterium]|nr:GTPase HflX [Tepidisphaeraceae bacterium]